MILRTVRRKKTKNDKEGKYREKQRRTKRRRSRSKKEEEEGGRMKEQALQTQPTGWL